MRDDTVYEKPMLVIRIFLLIVVAGLAMWFVSGVLTKQKEAKIYISNRFESRIFLANVADTEEKQNQGLSGTLKLDPDRALLMVFPHKDRWGIWMKDMNYPIDVAWLDESQGIVHVEHSMRPDSYPESVYRPKRPSKYVVELPAGTLGRMNVRVGDKIRIEMQ